MIDLISCVIPDGRIPVNLENEHIIPKGSCEIIQGNIKNLKIRKLPDNTIFLTGSLPKYLCGQNAVPLSRTGISEAIDTLEHDTGFDLHKSTLVQFEIGNTFPVTHPVNDYLTTFGYVTRFCRHAIGRNKLETVDYRTKSRTFKAYDKRSEMLHRKQPIPSVFGKSHMIRLELKYARGVKRIFNRPLTPYDLVSTDIYCRLIRLWQGFYFRIPKGIYAGFNLYDIGKVSDLKKELSRYALEKSGTDAVFSVITLLQDIGVFSKSDTTRSRLYIRGLIMDSLPDDLTAELDNLVRYSVINCH
ncbi:hypothetical protein K7I13_11825 [Brucepastera parasyntrophica]|uniref:hypothetical protein n=1 Tax=Brucepastera parasyntrophica TaxID=2880008 RepID=UPI00210D8596|nr:hypothetical protein [Brucepastera parasyntrophica]ULQ59177.1 hypothetical protein K7I13_11825 [Brucepastera parasyntrophica]